MSSPSSPTARDYGVLLLGVASVSTGAILARRCEAPALTVSLWRCGLAAFLLAAASAARSARVSGPAAPAPLPLRSAFATPLVCGALLAAHFALWIRSLELTSVSASVFLVATTPIWVALGSARVTGERVSSRGWAGLALGLAGSLIVALGAARGSSDAPGSEHASGVGAWLGPALAVGGAIAMGAFALLARRVRNELPLTTFLVRVYAFAAVFLAVLAIASGAPTLPASAAGLGWLAAGALVPQLIGHSAINAALRRLPAALVTLALLGEPLLATLWAWLLLHEAPRLATLLGGTLVLAGIAAAALPARARRSAG